MAQEILITTKSGMIVSVDVNDIINLRKNDKIDKIKLIEEGDK